MTSTLVQASGSPAHSRLPLASGLSAGRSTQLIVCPPLWRALRRYFSGSQPLIFGCWGYYTRKGTFCQGTFVGFFPLPPIGEVGTSVHLKLSWRGGLAHQPSIISCTSTPPWCDFVVLSPSPVPTGEGVPRGEWWREIVSHRCLLKLPLARGGSTTQSPMVPPSGTGRGPEGAPTQDDFGQGPDSAISIETAFWRRPTGASLQWDSGG